MIISLNNQRIRNFIKRQIGLPRYGEPFDTLVEETFVREQYVLGLSPDEFKEDLANFRNSIQKISYANGMDPNTMGMAIPRTKEIQFNFDYWKRAIDSVPMEQYCEMFFETFAHECLHGMQTMQSGNNRAGGYNREVENRAHALYEIGTQGTAAKMARNRSFKDYDSNNVLTGDGYSDEIFAIPLIASTFGVTEQEVLRYSVRERSKLVDVLNKNIGDRDKTAELLEKIEVQLEYLHSINYPDNNQKKFLDLTNDQRREMSSVAMENIAKLSLEAFTVRIKNTPLELKKEDVVQYKYDYKKIQDTLRQENERFSWKFDKTHLPFDMAFEFGPNSSYVKEAINVFSQIVKNPNSHMAQMIPSYVNAVRSEQFDFLRKEGIDLREEQTYGTVKEAREFASEIIATDYNGFASWDNSIIYPTIYNRTTPIPFTRNVNVYNCPELNSGEAIMKKNDLRIALLGHNMKYKTTSKDLLYDFMQSDNPERDGIYNRVTRTPISDYRYFGQISPREAFKRSFSSERDKILMARLIARSYVETNFDQEGTYLRRESTRDTKIQELFGQTVITYGPKQLEVAISEILLNDNYQMISGEKNREDLAIYGKRNLFDVLAGPLIQDMVNQRKIIPEKIDAFRRMTAITENRNPGTMALRYNRIIESFKNGQYAAPNIVSQNARGLYCSYFQDERGIEDMVGIICNDFAESKENEHGAQTSEEIVMMQVAQRYGKDFFRENMIKMIVHDDYSGFTDEKDVEMFRKMDKGRMLEIAAKPSIEKSMMYDQNIVYRVQDINSKVKPTDIAPVFQNKSVVKKTKDVFKNLLHIKDRGKTITTYSMADKATHTQEKSDEGR